VSIRLRLVAARHWKYDPPGLVGTNVNMASRPGILFVNSMITSDTLTPELFREWYEGVHIPDLLVTSGINSGVRYKATNPEQVERPYLAMYPVKNVQWLHSDEFKSVPLHSDMLPNDSKAIYELADFESRYYEKLDTKGEPGREGPAEFVVTVEFDSLTEDLAKLYELSTPEGMTPVRSRVFKLNFSRQSRPAYLGVVSPDLASYLTSLVGLLGSQPVTNWSIV
jgi:hypothetical protein